MDSEHRHELQQNDLEEFLTHFKEWWQKHGTNTLLTILIIVAVIFFYRWYSGREQRMLNTAYTELANAADPYAMTELAGEYDHIEGFAAAARLRAANQLTRQALGLETTAAAQEDAPVGEERQNMLEQARGLYQRVVESGSTTQLQVLNARFGLAAVQETLGDFEAAQQQYQTIQDEAGDQWSVLAARAKRLSSNISDIRQPIEFPEPPAPPAASTTPGAGQGESSFQSLENFDLSNVPEVPGAAESSEEDKPADSPIEIPPPPATE